MKKPSRHIEPLRRTARFACAAVAIVCCALGRDARAAVLGNAAPQQTADGIAVPITLYPAQGDTIASMQFNLVYDTRAFALAGAAPGPAAAQAGKDVIYAQHSGSATIIIAGFNQDILQGGLVATVYLQPLGDLVIPDAVGIRGAVFSDPLGQAIAPQGPGGNNTDPDPSPGVDPVDDDDKSTPPPAEPVEEGEPATEEPRRNYVNPGYGAPASGADFSDENSASAQGGDDRRRSVIDSGPIVAGGGGGGIPGAPAQPAAAPGQTGSYTPGYSPSPAGGNPSPALPSGGSAVSWNNSVPQPNANATDGTARGSSAVGGNPHGPVAANAFQNGAERPKSGLVFDSGTSAAYTTSAKSPVPLLLALIVATLFAGGAYYWRQAAPRARR